MAIAHFAVGVSITSLVLVLSGRYRMRNAPVLLFGGGILNMIPAGWQFPQLLTREFQLSIWSNIVTGHQFLDRHLDPSDSLGSAALFVAVMCVSMSVIYGLRVHHDRDSIPADDCPTVN